MDKPIEEQVRYHDLKHSIELPVYDIQGFTNPRNGYVKAMHYIMHGNSSDAMRATVVSNLAAISRGKDEANNAFSRFKALLKEGSHATPSRPVEFCLVKLSLLYLDPVEGGICPIIQIRDNENLDKVIYSAGIVSFNNQIGKWSIIKPRLASSHDYEYYTDKEGKQRVIYDIYTNLRTLVKSGVRPEDVSFNNFLPEARAFKIQAPMFVFNQLVTHTQISKEARSDRVTDINNTNYWVPEDIFTRISDYNLEDKDISLPEVSIVSLLQQHLAKNQDYDAFIEVLLDLPMRPFQKALKLLGYPKEIYQRALLEWRYKEFVMVGWDVVTNSTWQNLLLERNALPDDWKTWAQKETTKVVNVLKFFLREDMIDHPEMSFYKATKAQEAAMKESRVQELQEESAPEV